MSIDPTPPAESALKAYAEARRRAMGRPPAMPDQVRSRLHRELRSIAEAGRGAPAVASRRLVWVEWCLRPWAWMGAAALVAGLLIARHFVSDGSSDPALLASRPDSVGTATAQFARAPGTPPSGVSVSAGGSTEARARVSTTGLPETAAPAPSPVAPSQFAPAVRDQEIALRQSPTPADGVPLDADPRPPGLRPRGFLPNGTSNPEAALDSLAVAASHSVAAPTPSVGVGFRERAGSDRFQQRFTQSQPAPASPVLNSFQVEQVGRQLRLVDADGSVYPANLEVAIPVVTEPAAPAAPTLGPASRGPGLRGVQGPVLKRAGQEVEVRQEMPPTQVLALNAAGTNQQLQQRVVFAGNLVVTNLAGVPWVSEPTQLTTNWESLNQIFRNASVRGRVTVGGTNQYVVEAVPAGR